MIDTALIMLKMSPGLSDSEMEMLLHRQMDGWMPTTMSDAEVDAVIRNAIAEARKKLEARPPGRGAADEAARSEDLSRVSRVSCV